MEKINVYECEHGCLNTTIDVAHGVTPFMMKCKRKPTENRPIAKKFLDANNECIGMAKSSMYPRIRPIPDYIPTPSHEWYRPKLEEFEKLNRAEKDHAKQGGLLLRKRTEAKPILHDDESSESVVKLAISEFSKSSKKSKFGKSYFKQ